MAFSKKKRQTETVCSDRIPKMYSRCSFWQGRGTHLNLPRERFACGPGSFCEMVESNAQSKKIFILKKKKRKKTETEMMIPFAGRTRAFIANLMRRTFWNNIIDCLNRPLLC